MTTFSTFSRYIDDNAEHLATEVVEAVLHRMKLDIPAQEEEQARIMYVEFLRYLGGSLTEEAKDVIPSALIDWSKKNSEMQASSGRDILEIVVRYPPTREIFNELITGISIDLNLSVKENAYILKRINKMLDISLTETIYSYKLLSDQFKEDTQKELLKLSAPVVPIKDGIVVVPLIGYMDTSHIEHIITNVVAIIAELEVEHVIADFSGALTINMEIAESLDQIRKVLLLMGIHVVITGLRPEIVSTVVNSGIDFSTLKSYATVKQAINNLT
ncbi:STAS domain-containing protein [Virgibacillus sp. C22-A2]|uniref:STAS domain-containing protein n=1 Tax=Virgibacillus tibetensis TaxID=3042313 RepID=A0ABU6KF69_9BACI|nr:STAS domain-containing protein [Virgibacillus sp. C22-A2]